MQGAALFYLLHVGCDSDVTFLITTAIFLIMTATFPAMTATFLSRTVTSLP